MPDYLIELSKMLAGMVKKQNLENINFAEPSLQRLVSKDYNRIPIEIDDHGFLAALNFKVNSNLALSINKPDILFSFDTRLSHSNLKNIIYVSASDFEFSNPIPNRNIVLIDEFIFSLSLRKTEAVFIYNNKLIFGLETQRDLKSIIDEIIHWLNENRDIFSVDKLGKRSGLTSVPDQLKPILSRFMKYAVSDDVDRTDMIDEMGGDEKQIIIETVGPLLDEINSFLDSFEDKPLSEDAILLGNISELVSALQLKH